MLLDWLKLTCWLRCRGMDEPEIVNDVARNLDQAPYHVDANRIAPGRRATYVQKPARKFGTHETCERCGHIFNTATTSDIELVTGLCQACWARRRHDAHNRGDN